MRDRQTPQSALDARELSKLIGELPLGAGGISLLKHQDFKIEEVVMGDHYEVGQAGSVGPRSVAVGQNFTQVWHKTSADVDLRELAAELSRLREAARGFTTGSPEDELALAEIATAENAAKADDGAKVLRHLARAGEWALAIAKTIGVPVAVRALEAAIAG